MNPMRNGGCRSCGSTLLQLHRSNRGLRIVSIMPGMEARAPERTETNNGLSMSPNLGASAFLRAQWHFLLPVSTRQQLFLPHFIIFCANFCRNCEARRNRNSDKVHLCQVGSLTPPKGFSCRLSLLPDRYQRYKLFFLSII